MFKIKQFIKQFKLIFALDKIMDAQILRQQIGKNFITFSI